MIGIVINDLGNPFFAEMLVGMERRLVDAGYISLMAHTNERLDVQDIVLTSMHEYHAAGVILCPAFDTPQTLLAAHAARRHSAGDRGAGTGGPAATTSSAPTTRAALSTSAAIWSGRGIAGLCSLVESAAGRCTTSGAQDMNGP